ncbi:co(2)-response secreted protease [Phtheirospermum japonicum]|uniref:Co(2)-response secreted protease n=1 Tax=Phtheirospermum japonicum TaxID=374723 RepID=A0A830D7N3_9LAMI|nr:co(2)-response secreted protease [Phtheirospermum japonicum]
MFLLHTYERGFLGFAARLTDEEAKSLSSRPGVVSVFPDIVFQIQTTRSWEFLEQQQVIDLEFDSTPRSIAYNSSTVGADTIIGFLDTGIWPESQSFNDADMGPIPSRWKGMCMAGDNFTSSSCNRKLIGARFYDDEFGSYVMGTPRDGKGHGTHVASIAAGRHFVGASYYGLARGTARGGSPTSRIAVYRVCTVKPQPGCFGSAILKGFDDAIADGVDVLSISIVYYKPTVPDFSADPIAIGAFHAVEQGIMVVCAAGNLGPSPATVVNVAPWILTVAATTIDRAFVAGVVLGGNQEIIKGQGINFSNLKRTPIYPLIDGVSAKYRNILIFSFKFRSCTPGSLDGEKVKGKILMCVNTVMFNQVVNKFEKLKSFYGVIGMILIDNEGEQMAPEFGIHPIAVVSVEDGLRVLSYIRSNSNPVATILPTVVVTPNNKSAPVVAKFSSRGPTPGFEGLLKPDIAAPGVMILAAWPTFVTEETVMGREPPPFAILSGTSMACPHVAALAAMVKSRNPTWGPSAIRSAIMTTAINRNNLDSPITTTLRGSRATPYDIGAGEISTSGPIQPGLVYETETLDYITFLCDISYNQTKIELIAPGVLCPVNNKSSSDSVSDMNYPSFSISNLKENELRTVARTVTNVGEDDESIYEAAVDAPAGVDVQVVPGQLHFTKDVRKLRFQVAFKLTSAVKSRGGGEDVLFGTIVWTSAERKVRSPFVVTIVSNPHVTHSGCAARASVSYMFLLLSLLFV